MAEYIERKAFIKRLNSLAADIVFRGCDTMIHGKDSCNPREWTRGYQEGVMLAINKIESQAAADVAPVVHGRWQKQYDEFCIDRGWMCTSCRGSVYHMTYEKYEYCPHCGARMDGE